MGNNKDYAIERIANEQGLRIEELKPAYKEMLLKMTYAQLYMVSSMVRRAEMKGIKLGRLSEQEGV